MFRKLLSLFLAAFILNLFLLQVPALAGGKGQKAPPASEQIKTCIARVGQGRFDKDSLIDVRTKDGRKILGFVAEVKEDSFTLREPESAALINLRYEEVEKFTCGNEIGQKRLKKQAITMAVFIGGLLLLTIALVPKT